MISATLAQKYGWTFWQILPLVLAIGCLFGLFMGVLIQIFKLQAFIVTLGRDVSGARPVLRDQHRLDLDYRAELHRALRVPDYRWAKRRSSRRGRWSRWRSCWSASYIAHFTALRAHGATRSAATSGRRC